MIKAVSIALIAGGVLLLILGIDASNALSSDVSRFFTGSATDKAVWLIVGGVVGIVAGLVGLSRGSKKS